MCACVRVCGLYIAWVHLWMCAKAHADVYERRGNPPQSGSGQRVGEARETPGRTGWDSPFTASAFPNL